MQSADKRHAKGTGVIEVVRTLRAHRRQGVLKDLSPAAEQLLDTHILPNEWYSFAAFRELLDFMYEHLLGSSEEAALQAGITGGRTLLKGPHKGFVTPGDPAATVYAMRHTWRVYFDFGSLEAEIVEGPAVRFTVSGYPDVSIMHGMTIAGWAVAAAQLAGSRNAGCEMLERPWQGDAQLVYRVYWSKPPTS